MYPIHHNHVISSAPLFNFPDPYTICTKSMLLVLGVYLYVQVYVCMYVCMYVLYVCMYVCMVSRMVGMYACDCLCFSETYSYKSVSDIHVQICVNVLFRLLYFLAAAHVQETSPLLDGWLCSCGICHTRMAWLQSTLYCTKWPTGN